MYQKILLALDATDAGRALVAHVRELAAFHHSKLVLVHVADGWAARNFDALKLAESEEMKKDREYLDATANDLRSAGFEVETQLALGNPPTEILKTAESLHCDLIAMTTHGHRLFKDLLFGSTIEPVRHRASVPVLLVRASGK